MMAQRFMKFLFVPIAGGILLASQLAMGQGDGNRRQKGAPKPVTVPVTIKVKKPEVEIRVVDLLLREDGDVQELLSLRGPSDSPITLAVLLQDDLVSSIGTEAKGIGEFVRSLPAGSRAMIGYIRNGSLDIRRKFTSELDE